LGYDFYRFHYPIHHSRSLAYNLTLDIYSGFALERALSRAHILAHTRILDNTIELEFDVKPDLEFAKKSKEMVGDYLMCIGLLIVRIFSFTNRFEKLIQNDFERTLIFFHESILQMNAWGLDVLVTQLNDLMSSFPSKTAPQSQWQAFAGQFQQLLQREFNIAHQWELSHSQLTVLGDYLAANSLLLECLNIATVSNREAIKNNLLMPPS